MSRRENYYSKLEAVLSRALQRREQHLRALCRTEDTIRDLRIRLKRRKEGAALAQKCDEMIKGIAALKNPEEPSSPPVSEEPPIPEFLQRQRIADADARDKEIADRIRAEQAEKKKERAQQRKEKKDIVAPSKFTDEKAKQLPLTGRAALDFIKRKR
jgi:hypothetical protein